ncbi:MAG: hypothetical protein HFG30_06105 [Eubacterium sp.]|nr:hypothetical protein [Eubacterium sp.]
MKKVVIFIVEGQTDKRTLEKIFKKIYRNKNIHYEVTDGDITTNDKININNVENEIFNLINAYLKDQKLKVSDVWQIVHIFDMDGAYIPDDNIIEGSSSKFVYSTTNISCNNIEKVKERNSKKRTIMDYLLKVSTIRNIPYKCYYLSSNLEHALYDKLNLSEEEKRDYADDSYDMFLDKEILFVEFLNKVVVNGVPDSFPSSWRYIKEELHSLERHTNLNLYFKENPIL